MAAVRTYHPKKVTCALGRHIVTGFSDDGMITIDKDGDGTTHMVGAHGEVVRSIDPSEVYTMKISLLQNTPTNQYLQRMYDKDQTDGTGTFSVNINDIFGKEKFFGDTAWVKKPATFTRAKAATNREWEIVVANCVFE